MSLFSMAHSRVIVAAEVPLATKAAFEYFTFEYQPSTITWLDAKFSFEKERIHKTAAAAG